MEFRNRLLVSEEVLLIVIIRFEDKIVYENELEIFMSCVEEIIVSLWVDFSDVVFELR